MINDVIQSARNAEDKPSALRYNEGKPKLSMLMEMPDALTGVTHVLEFGAAKYARSNFLNGLPMTQVVDSMARHLLKFMSGEDIDAESGLPHVDHIACNALFLSQFQHTHPHCDDRSIINVTSLRPKQTKGAN